MDASVALEIFDGLAVVSLNRASALNALDEAMACALADIVEGLDGEAAVRAVLLRGEGRGFCAGGDVSTFGSDLEALERLLIGLHRAASALRRLSTPGDRAIARGRRGRGSFALPGL